MDILLILPHTDKAETPEQVFVPRAVRVGREAGPGRTTSVPFRGVHSVKHCQRKPMRSFLGRSCAASVHLVGFCVAGWGCMCHLPVRFGRGRDGPTAAMWCCGGAV